jgi:hypothetical protein
MDEELDVAPVEEFNSCIKRISHEEIQRFAMDDTYLMPNPIRCNPHSFECVACGSEKRWKERDPLPWAWLAKHRRCEGTS